MVEYNYKIYDIHNLADIKDRCDVDKNGCWNWKHCLNDRGYGLVDFNGKTRKTHRVSYFMWKGEELPSSIFLCHTCDNPKCVNPEHLFEGNTWDNMKDMVDKGRSAKGESHGMHKLTPREVKEIRRKYIPRVYSQRKLAKEYNVSQGSIFLVLKESIWKHV